MVFNWLSKRRPQAYPQAPRAEDVVQAQERAAASWKAMVKRVSLLESRCDDLEEKLSTTVSHLHKLRGQVHGPRAHQVRAQSTDEIPFGDKAALRARAGLGIGRFVHPPETTEE